MNHLRGKLLITRSATVQSTATIPQGTLDTAQDQIGLKHGPEGAHFARQREAETLELFHA